MSYGYRIKHLRDALLNWYDAGRRDFPWRRTSDPYRIWVSEVMLQQTRADVVVPYYERFLHAYPSLDALACAPLDDVLATWSGLGYYRRARSLHAAVAECRERYGGEVPRDADAFRALSGVGPYTTAAVQSIAFAAPLAVVDGNVVRVVARLQTLPGHAKSTRMLAAVRAVADELLDQSRPGDFNQAMMELGATICTPRAPRCATCPIGGHCRANANGSPEQWPAASPRTASHTVEWRAALIERRGRVLFARRTGQAQLEDMWELPWTDAEAVNLNERYRLQVVLGSVLTTVRHSILDERITVTVHRSTLVGPAPRRGFCWVAPGDVSRVAMSSVWRKVMRSLLASDQSMKPILAPSPVTPTGARNGA